MMPPLGLVGVDVWHGQCLCESSQAEENGARAKDYKTATYREGHGEVLQSHTRELEDMKLVAKTL